MRTVKARSEIDAIFSSGRRFSTPLMSALIIETPPSRGPEGRVMFVAGKRLGHAVIRNRAKRVLRATVARAGGPWEGLDVALVAREATAGAQAAALLDALTGILARAGVRE